MKAMHFKKFTAVALVFGAIFLLNNEVKGQMFLGGKVAGSNTTIQGDLPGNNYNQNFSGGLIVGYTFTEDDLFSVQSEIQYSMKGTNQKYEEIPELPNSADAERVVRQYDNDLDLTYIEMPIMAKLSLALGSSTFPYGTGSGSFSVDFYAGPYVGYLMDAEATRMVTTTRTIENIKENGETVEQTIETKSDRGRFRTSNQFENGVSMPELINALEDASEGNPFAQAISAPDDLKNGLSTLDLGLVGGIGMSLDLGDNSKITLDGRFSRGLFSVDDLYFNSIKFETDQNGVPSVKQSKADLFNTAVSVNLGYIYKFGGGYSFN